MPSDTSDAFPNDSESYETCDEIVYHIPPDFNIPVGQKHRHIVIVPGKQSDYECRCSEHEVSDSHKENCIPEASGTTVDDSVVLL